MLRITISPSTYFFTFMQKKQHFDSIKTLDNELDNEKFDFFTSSLHQNNVECITGKYPVEIQEDITGYWSCRNIQKSDFQDFNFETTEVVL